ncbi:hypothetical protein P8C59_006125 [Phyllachora maydis]|uniref:TATA-binding protein interacting (TIP20) domain-containing protein n=1 Tax=Phyllachora maydis TaxID=1825666 RepID=A0AAD9I5T7_9PEZI|nr:hypothetical protein P8C59_006125 [Phyllachora maydis]
MGSEFSADELFRYRVDKKMIAVSAFCQLLEAREIFQNREVPHKPWAADIFVEGTIAVLLPKLTDADPDFRFMGLSDLLFVLSIGKPEILHHDYNTASRTVDYLVKTLDDQNGEVQNQALKCLGPLVKKLAPPSYGPLMEKLAALKLKNSVDTAVPALALKAVVEALPRPVLGVAPTTPVQESYSTISRVLIPRLLNRSASGRIAGGLLSGEQELNSDSIDVLIEVVSCFGPVLQPVEVEALQDGVVTLLEQDKGNSVVKKRAVVAISMLARYLSDDLLTAFIDRTTKALGSGSLNPVTRRLYITILGSMARSIPHRFGKHVAATVSLILEALGEEEYQAHMEEINDGADVGLEFNHVREAALVALEAYLASCPNQMRPFTDESIAASLRYLKFNPNYALDEDEDEEMDEDEEEEDFGNDEEFEADGGFDDDEDASWKVRRCAAKTLYTTISTRSSGDLLDSGVLYPKYHSSNVLQPFLPGIVEGVVSVVHDRYYKISGEAIQTAEEVVKAITPPRARLTAQNFKGDLQKLYEVIIDLLGEAGLRLGQDFPIEPSLFLQQFTNEYDRASLSAAIALGRAGAGNPDKYVPVILQSLKKQGSTQYLLLQSIKEVLQQASVSSTDIKDNKAVCAECVGRMVIIDPETYMPRLDALLRHDSVSLRAIAVQALRYTLPDENEAFDAMLKNYLVDMLKTILEDCQRDIRRHAMSTLNSACHNRPELILGHLGLLMPYVMQEAVVKPELVREVQFGPFKHIIDDGLEVRKAAYETLYAMMETAFSRISIIDLYDRIIAGLRDDNEIRALCNLMVTKLVHIDPDETTRRLDAIADAFRATLSTPTRDNAVKQDHERQEEANKSYQRHFASQIKALQDEGSKEPYASAV